MTTIVRSDYLGQHLASYAKVVILSGKAPERFGKQAGHVLWSGLLIQQRATVHERMCGDKASHLLVKQDVSQL